MVKVESFALDLYYLSDLLNILRDLVSPRLEFGRRNLFVFIYSKEHQMNRVGVEVILLLMHGSVKCN
jgi:hypothetical protein